MYAIVSPKELNLAPGTVVHLLGDWQDYLALYEQRGGDNSLPRIKYRPGEILLMAPLAEHGRGADLASDIAKVLLDHGEQDYEAFTPITLKLAERSGIEPDYCFYIDNWEAIAGKKRIDWDNDPPPDLVIEMDVTSYTDVNDYLPFRVPEVWLFKAEQLRIYGLQDNTYVLQARSRFFPEFDVFAILQECLQLASERSRSHAIRSLRRKLQEMTY